MNAPFVVHSRRGEAVASANTMSGALKNQSTLRGVIKRAGEVVVNAITDHIAAGIDEKHPNAVSELDLRDGVGRRGGDPA